MQKIIRREIKRNLNNLNAYNRGLQRILIYLHKSATIILTINFSAIRITLYLGRQIVYNETDRCMWKLITIFLLSDDRIQDE